MSKELVLMNIQLHAVLRDITGQSGLKVTNAVIAGERDPKALSNLVSYRVKASREDIEKAMVCDYRPECLFELGQCLQLYNYYWQKITETDNQINGLLKENVQEPEGLKGYKAPKNKQHQKNDPKFNVGKYAYLMSNGTDLLQISGVGAATVLTVISETGMDLKAKFKTASHFVSWLGFAPNRKITGGKVISSRTRKKTNPLAKAIRDVANAAGNSQGRLGDFFRRLAYRKGRMVAINATARKIGVIIYKMVSEGIPYSYDYAQEETQYIYNRKIKNIIKTLKKYNIQKQEMEIAWS
jgi:transposase